MHSEEPPEKENEYRSSLSVYDDHGNLLEFIKYNDSEEEEEKTISVYDSNNHLMSEETFYVLDDTSEKRTIKRNEQGDAVEEIKTFTDGSESRQEFVYETGANKMNVTHYDEDNKVEFLESFIFSDEKRTDLSEYTKTDPNAKIIENSKFIHDPANNSLIQEYFSAEGNIRSKRIMKFNEHGVELESAEYNEKGEVTSKTYSEYDENGNISRKIIKDFHSRTVNYQYDEKNRVVVEDLFDENNTLIRRQTYEYDESDNVLEDTYYQIDVTRSGRDEYTGNRYEYEYFG